MSGRFTLGIEEEFQLVNRQTLQLSSRVKSIMEKGTPLFAENIKPELTQSTIELISDICPDIATARRDLSTRRVLLTRLVNDEGLALVSAGTHPISSWRDQDTTEKERYEDLEEEYQDIIRSNIIFGLHVHVGVEGKDLAVKLMNQVRTWLPHILAISTNAPFWRGHNTGIKSYRSALWKRVPRSGMPRFLPRGKRLTSMCRRLWRWDVSITAKKSGGICGHTHFLTRWSSASAICQPPLKIHWRLPRCARP